MEHLSHVRTEREKYHIKYQQATEQWKDHCKKHPSSSIYESVVHYNFDNAQQIHCAQNNQLPGPAYFLTAWKCQLLGVCNEAQAEQTKYPIDKADNTGMGTNTITSSRSND